MTHQPVSPDAPAVNITEPQMTGAPDATALLVGAAILLPAVLAGCGGGGGGSAAPGSTPTPPALTITAIEVQAVTASPVGAPVTVDGVVQPVTGGVINQLNGAVGRERDPGKKGASSVRSFLVHADAGTMDLDITVTFNPTAVAVSGLSLPGKATYAQARHLTARLGFGGSWDDIMALMGVSYETAVDLLVDAMDTTPMQSPPSWINDTILTWAEFSALSTDAQNQYNDRKYPRRFELKKWWLREIIKTPNPLTERLVAFWGNHFVVNIDDIEEPQIAWSWLSLLRTHASGNLRTFLHAMCLHPAMLIFLDNASNVKTRAPGAPNTDPQKIPSNENFGRELLELFALGERTPTWQVTPEVAPYTEDDVIAVARAFTGHNLDERKNYLFFPTKHDALTDMTFLGSATAQYGGTAGNVNDIISVILNKRMSGGEPPRAAQLVVEKLWAEFIGIMPDPGSPAAAKVNELATNFAATWDLKPLYKVFFKTSYFKDGADDYARKLLKMPLELIAGFYRSLDITPEEASTAWPNWSHAVWSSDDEDQNPLAPPNVKGWLGGTTWINTKTLVSRYNDLGGFGHRMTTLGDAKLPQFLLTDYEAFMLAVPRYFPEPTPSYNPSWQEPIATRLRRVIQDPAYHMK